MAQTGTSMTQIARLEARRNEEQVIAEGALNGERRVTVLRLITVFLFATSHRVLGPLFGLGVDDTARRLVPIAFYVVYAVALFWRLRSVRPSPTRSKFFPLLAMVTDFAFFTYMAVLDVHLFGTSVPPMTTIAMALLVCFSVARYSWVHVALAALLAVLCYVGVAVWAGHVSAPSTVFVAGGFAALGLFVGWTNYAVRRMFTDLRRRDHLSRFLPAKLVERVLALAGAPLEPVQREVTVLFADIRDFTTLSEAMPPREVLELLDDLFGRLSQVVKGHDGIVNKFLGDGMLAIWGVPDKTDAHAERALRAAVDLRLVVAELNELRAARRLAPLRVGVGVHTGVVAAGMLGGPDQHEYTVIGDAVNVASRIEGLNKTLGTDLLASADAWARAGGHFQGRRLPPQPLKGRTEPVEVWALEGLPSSSHTAQPGIGQPPQSSEHETQPSVASQVPSPQPGGHGPQSPGQA